MHIERTRVARRPQANELVNSIIAENPKPKLTHKLPPMICVLWLRDLRGFLSSFDLFAGRVRVTPDPHEALRLPEEDAERIGQEIIDSIGYRIELRPYRSGPITIEG